MYMIILLIALFEIPKLLFDFFLKIVLFSKSQIIQITISRIYGYLPKNTVFYDVFTQIRTITNIYEQTSRKIGIIVSVLAYNMAENIIVMYTIYCCKLW